MSNLDNFSNALSDTGTLTPRVIKDSKGKITKTIAQAIYTRQVVTIVGIKITTSRFLPVSHAGYSNETYVDKVDLLGKSRAEFIARKLKGVERRAHMALFREMTEANWADEKAPPDWRKFFKEKFGRECTIPNELCIACWNCSLFGGLEAGKGATFSRIRYFDTFSVEDAAECTQTDDSPEQMAIGNTVGEDLSVERGEASFHRYEYVKAGTHFPFITIIESPTLLDVAGYLAAVKLADQHGYGRYSANHGKFETKFLAVSTGYPLFSVLDLLTWFENDALTGTNDKKADDKKAQSDPAPPNKPEGSITDKLKFEAPAGQPAPLSGASVVEIQKKLKDEFKSYIAALGGAHPGAGKEPKAKKQK